VTLEAVLLETIQSRRANHSGGQVSFLLDTGYVRGCALRIGVLVAWGEGDRGDVAADCSREFMRGFSALAPRTSASDVSTRAERSVRA